MMLYFLLPAHKNRSELKIDGIDSEGVIDPLEFLFDARENRTLQSEVMWSSSAEEILPWMQQDCLPAGWGEGQCHHCLPPYHQGDAGRSWER